MLCENCKKRQATTHIKRVINGVSEEFHLCAQCAAQLHENDFDPFELSSLWGSLFDNRLPQAADSTRCESCGSSFAEIAKRGRLGCPSCYKTFREQLKPSLLKMHGKTHHIGKIPDTADDGAKNAYRLKELKQQLKTAVENEEYEKCAALRDEIKKLSEEGEQNEKNS